MNDPYDTSNNFGITAGLESGATYEFAHGSKAAAVIPRKD